MEILLQSIQKLFTIRFIRGNQLYLLPIQTTEKETSVVIELPDVVQLARHADVILSPMDKAQVVDAAFTANCMPTASIFSFVPALTETASNSTFNN